MVQERQWPLLKIHWPEPQDTMCLLTFNQNPKLSLTAIKAFVSCSPAIHTFLYPSGPGTQLGNKWET